MREEDCKRIRKTYRSLVDNIHAVAVVDYLITENAIDVEDEEEIQAQTTTKGKARKLLKILMHKPSVDVFTIFCKVLRECDANYGYLADEMESADISDVPDSPQVDEVDANAILVEELRKQLVIQTQLIVEMRLDYQKNQLEMATLLGQMRVREQNADVADVVDAGFREENIRDYVRQYCTSASDNVLSSNNSAPQGHMLNPPSQTLESIWSLIRTTAAATGRSESSCSTSLSVEEIACRLGADVVLHTILSRSQRLAESMSRSASGDSIMVSNRSFAAAQSDSSVLNEASIIMKSLVASTLNERAKEFDAMIGQLDIIELEGYTTFKEIADDLFGTTEEGIQHGMNWGRVVAWYALWAHFASNLPVDEHLEERANVYGRFVGFYLARRINSWISSAGGWEGFVAQYKKSDGSPYGGFVWRLIVELFRHYPLRP